MADEDDFMLNLDFGAAKPKDAGAKKQVPTSTEPDRPTSTQPAKSPGITKAQRSNPPAQPADRPAYTSLNRDNPANPSPRSQKATSQQHAQRLNHGPASANAVNGKPPRPTDGYHTQAQNGSMGQPAGRGGGRGGRGGGQGGGRGGRGGGRGNKGGGEGVEERAADSGEDEEVAQLVALVSKRDAALERELGTAAGGKRPAQEAQGVVDFEEESDDDHAHKRRRKFAPAVGTSGANGQAGGAQGGSGGGGAAGDRGRVGGRQGRGRDKATKEVEQQQPKRVTLAPGQLTHAGEGEDAAELFGDGKPANSSGGHASNGCTPVTAGGAAAGTWESLDLDPKLCGQLSQLKFERPTRVQCASIPALVAGKDVLVRAATGSGKTLAYLVPIIQDLGHQVPRIGRSDGTYALVVAPTRELCLQIQDVAVQILQRYIWLVAGIVIGGENRTHEKSRLRKGVTLLVATPGRLADHLHSTASFNTSVLRWLILDEADRLLDLGFEARLKEIVELIDKRRTAGGGQASQGDGMKRRTTALLSATLHAGLGSLASMSLHEPVAVGFTMQKSASGLELKETAHAPVPGTAAAGATGAATGGGQLVLEAGGERYELPSQLRQSFIQVEAKQRLVTLAGLLRQKLLGGARGAAIGPKGRKTPEGEQQAPVKRKAVVFLSSCDGVELHHLLLGGAAWRQAAGGPLLGADMPLLKLHGDMPQAQRTAAFVTFTQASCAVLLCTDVAARGLDFPDVTFIVQYDVPGAPTEYVHRVGRTARMGHTGEAVLLLMPHERPYADLLAARGVALGEVQAEGPLRWLPQVASGMDDGYVASRQSRGNVATGQAAKPMALAFALQRKLMQAVAADPQLHALASDAFRSFVRAYATHSGDVKRYFHVRNLHLGHVAFAHGLKDVPTLLGSSGSAVERKRKRAEDVAAKQRVAKKKLYKQAALLGVRKPGVE